MPAHEIMQQSEFLFYSANERGLRVMLGEHEYVQFSDSPDKPWLASIKINRRDDDGKLVPIEEKWELARKLEKTRHYERGWIQYVPSPEEMRHREKITRQNEACDQLREDLKGGLLILPLESMSPEQLTALAERIGAPLLARNGKALSTEGLRKSIANRLGLLSDEPEPVASVVEEPVLIETVTEESTSQPVEAVEKPKPGRKPNRKMR